MPEAVLIALTSEAADALRKGIAGRDRDGVVVQLARPPLRSAIEVAREQHGRVPLGVVARTPPEAIEAIELGADEAIASSSPDPSAVVDLLARTRARGILRAQAEHDRLDLAHAEKLTALGTLVAGVAHEINNPLAVIVLSLEAFSSGVRAAADVVEEVMRAADEGRALGVHDVARIASLGAALQSRDTIAEHFEAMQRAAGTIRAVVQDLRMFARSDEGEPRQLVRIPELLEQLLRLVGREITATAVIERDYGADLPEVLVAPTRLTQVLTNVLVNASHAMREVQRSLHRLRVTVRADDDAVAIAISDTGPGIPAHALERIFDPFYTTKRASLGTGLGLSISRNLMRNMGGDLVVESVFGEGATFVVLVPRAGDDEIRAARLRSRRAVVSTAAKRSSVLLVDDDSEVLRAYSRLLGRTHDLLLAADAREAIEMLSSGSRPEVVLLDLGLASDEGVRLHRWLLANVPALASRVVFVANELSARQRAHLCEIANAIVLPKPATGAQLVDAIDQASRR